MHDHKHIYTVHCLSTLGLTAYASSQAQFEYLQRQLAEGSTAAAAHTARITELQQQVADATKGSWHREALHKPLTWHGLQSLSSRRVMMQPPTVM